MPGLQVFLELSANPPQRLQRDAMLAQLTRHEQLDQIEEADRALVGDELIIAREYASFQPDGRPSAEPFPDSRGLQLGELRGFGKAINSSAKNCIHNFTRGVNVLSQT